MGFLTSQGSTQASGAYNNAVNTAGMLGGAASGIGSTITPFLTQEMTNPTGVGQQGLSAEEAAATGGAGGALSAFQGSMAQRAGASRNAGGFQAGMDAASRNAAQAAAGSSEGIAAGNQQLMQQQKQQGAAGLGSMYKTDTSGMLSAMGQEAGDVNAETNATQTSGLNQSMGVLKGLGSMAGGAGSMMMGGSQAGLWGTPMGCWVAAEIFGGWHEPRTVLVREWLFGPFRKTLMGRIITDFYLKYGERIAEGVRKSRLLRAVLTPLFEAVLRKARG